MAEIKVNYKKTHPIESIQMTLSPEEAYLIYTLCGSLTGSFDGPRKYNSAIYKVLLNVFKEGNTASDCLLHGAHFKDYCLQEFLKKMQDAIKE